MVLVRDDTCVDEGLLYTENERSSLVMSEVDTHAHLRIKRVYEEPDREDGTRVLVDRLSPRGLTKQEAKVDLWLKDISPSNELRKWLGHDPAKWTEFKRRYEGESRVEGAPGGACSSAGDGQ